MARAFLAHDKAQIEGLCLSQDFRTFPTGLCLRINSPLRMQLYLHTKCTHARVHTHAFTHTHTSKLGVTDFQGGIAFPERWGRFLTAVPANPL